MTLNPEIYTPEAMAGKPITVATCFWEPNVTSYDFSRAYTTQWVEKLFTGFRDKLSRPMKFVVFTDKIRQYSTPLIEQRLLETNPPSYAAMLEPFKLNEPMIVVGLDTIVTGSCDEMADYCFYGDRIAVPRDPFYPDKLCNGVALVPAGQAWLWNNRNLELSDMEWVRANADRMAVIDNLFPGQCKSFKGEVKSNGPGDARIVYFHGFPKADTLGHIGWIARAWGT